VLTLEDRRRGALGAAAAKRVKREAARELAIERIAGLADKAVMRLEQLLDSSDDRVAVKAAKDVLDRVLGRATQTTLTAEVELETKNPEELETSQLRARLARLMAAAEAKYLPAGEDDVPGYADGVEA
jgi:hypothetical protein